MFPEHTDQVVTLNAPTFISHGDAFLTSMGFTPQLIIGVRVKLTANDLSSLLAKWHD
jgi:hypothetical protein